MCKEFSRLSIGLSLVLTLWARSFHILSQRKNKMADMIQSLSSSQGTYHYRVSHYIMIMGTRLLTTQVLILILIELCVRNPKWPTWFNRLVPKVHGFNITMKLVTMSQVPNYLDSLFYSQKVCGDVLKLVEHFVNIWLKTLILNICNVDKN